MTSSSHDSTHTGAQPPVQPHGGRSLPLVVLGALGVVYGDIGTSPLYAVKECFSTAHGVAPTEANILGVLSLIFWALITVVSIKYVVFILRADNRGEGGELALMTLALRRTDASRKRTRMVILALGLFGAALLYGDGMITPAISVLSAVEGISIITPVFEPYILPITVAILCGLFLVQSRGTHRIGTVFGPLVLTWFAVLGVLGVRGILMHPRVLEAIIPTHAVTFFIENQWHGFIVLAAVFLSVTGGEALYTDMGHFGRLPIRIGWFAVALPALLVNYFGQGGLLLENPSASTSPFFNLAPAWGLIPLVILATMATAVASQAVISGAFSLTRQAVQLGYLPRLTIHHTSSLEIGQIYVPAVNLLLAVVTIILVLTLKTSTALAGAYGMGVASTMVVTTILTFFVARRSWGWAMWAIVPVLGAFLIIDLAFFAANTTKIVHNGFVPLLIGAGMFTLMTTWLRGRELLTERLEARAFPLDMFIADAAKHPPVRVSGVSVFMTSSPTGTPVALLHNVKNNKVLHEIVVLLSVKTEEIPVVAKAERITIEVLEQGFRRVTARYGFTEAPNVRELLDLCREHGHDWPLQKTTFFLGRTTLIPTDRPGLARWRKRLFSLMGRNAERATTFFNIPPGRVVELGMQVEL